MNMSPMSRRQLLGLGVTAGATAMLAGCATPGTASVNTLPTIPAADGPVKLQYWAWLKGLEEDDESDDEILDEEVGVLT